MKTLAVVLVAGAFWGVACAGGAKPPMQPDNDSTGTELDDGGPPPAPPPAPSAK
jgi:hypothetical protein